jgi:hypothetical protein
MLNPSTADATVNDPTIRRCLSFAERDSFTDVTVVNLFAFRATNPSMLKIVEDPIGPENDRYIEKEVEAHRFGQHKIVAAWGAHPSAKERASDIHRWFGPFECLGVTKGGAPRHPLYVHGDQKFELYKSDGEML